MKGKLTYSYEEGGDTEMKGWKLTFKYKSDGHVLELELTGDQRAIMLGLNMAYLTMGGVVKKIMENTSPPVRMMEESAKLLAIKEGVAIAAYDGKYLKIEPVEEVFGLTSSVRAEWKDR